MNKSALFPSLNEILFAVKDAGLIEQEIITHYETLSGRTLARGDPVRLFLESIALIIIQQRNIIDYAAKMNLLAYAQGDYLDHIGAMLNVVRLPASNALTTIEFTLSEIQPVNIIIPQGTRLTAGDSVLFATVEALEIPSGSLTGQIKAQCTQTGTIGNGYLPGQIKKIADIFPYEMKCVNLTESAGGAEIESDENFRERIQIAPESFTSAGSVGAYTYFARTASSDIGDVAIAGPPTTEPGHVNIYPLMADGSLPTQEILDAVYEVCNADDVKPDTDYLHVLSPVEVNYEVDLTYYIDKENATVSNQIISQVNQAVQGWINWQHSKLGRDLNPSELNYRVINAGAKRCVIHSPEFKVLEPQEIAICSGQNVIFGGLEEA